MLFKIVDSVLDFENMETFYLIHSNWDDYGYRIIFRLFSYNKDVKSYIEYGTIKIGCFNLKSRVEPIVNRYGFNSYSIKELLPEEAFDRLPEDFFSLGQDISYYKKVNEILAENSIVLYESLNDLANNIKFFNKLYNDSLGILLDSMMRDIHYPVVEQFNRIINGEVELTPYSFKFKYNSQIINIDVEPNSYPPTNIHVFIGRNGVGKTWLLYNIVNKLLENNGNRIPTEKSIKYEVSENFSIDCLANSFSGVIGLSYSVFDDALSVEIDKNYLNRFRESELKSMKDKFNKQYKYIGLVSKNQKNGKTKTKSVEDLKTEFEETLFNIKKTKSKIDIYLETCEKLNSDPMFSDNKFIKIVSEYLKCESKARDKLDKVIDNFSRLSSGHMIIILSLTLLSDSIHEKTIVVIDEPETHLHPPLLSTYMRTLSYLLIKKNAVALIATHSPIVLQEVPKHCVNRIERTGSNMVFSEIESESFATSFDSLTREVFGLEIIKTGFYQLIKNELEEDYEKTIEKFGNSVGYLGKILIQSLANKVVKDNEKNK